MALFARKKFVWNEPWFFQQRIRTFQAWVRITLFLSAIALVIGAVLFFSRGNAAKPISLFEIIAMSLGVSAAVWWVLGQYLERIGSAASSQALVEMARKQLCKRPDTLLKPSIESVPVEVFERSQFANRIQMIREMGFLQADHAKKRIVYEGKKERWILPVGAIQSISIEEVQIGTPGQSATGLLNFYVVVRFRTTEDQEFGFRHGERDYGEFDDTKRAQGAIQLFELFDSVLSSTIKV